MTLTEDDKKAIVEWMGLYDNPKLQGTFSSDDWYSLGKCKEKIVRDGKWEDFWYFCSQRCDRMFRPFEFSRWLFTPTNFFPLVAEAIKEKVI